MSDRLSVCDIGEVFISYSWDSEEHIKAVLSLSDRLRSEGIDCVLDQYEVSPPEGWPRWMDRKIADASLVLVICTETYFNRATGHETPDRGNGVKWESGIIYQHLYNQGSENVKFIPVVFGETDRRYIPLPLQGASCFSANTEAGYERLYGRLIGRPQAQKPPLGQRRSMPKKEVQTDLVAYIASPIDIPLWDKAKWRATLFALPPGSPPLLGIAFLNQLPAEKIFEQWQHRYGKRDEFEELRIAIIEGDVAGEDPGYSVHVGVDLDNVLKRYRQAGLPTEGGSYFALTSRINRMTPAPRSPYLSLFKDSYKQQGEYLLVPTTCKPDGSDIKIAHHLAIRKSVVHFRNMADISANDIDAVVLRTGERKRPLTDHGRATQSNEA